MGSTNTTISDLTTTLFVNTDSNESAVVVKAASATIYFVEVDNTLNSVSSYVKLYNATSATPGTTVPDQVLEIPAGKVISFAFPQGLVFGTGLVASTVTVGGTTGTTGPTNDVRLEIAYT
jgi:hypothetical protein